MTDTDRPAPDDEPSHPNASSAEPPGDAATGDSVELAGASGSVVAGSTEGPEGSEAAAGSESAEVSVGSGAGAGSDGAVGSGAAMPSRRGRRAVLAAVRGVVVLVVAVIGYQALIPQTHTDRTRLKQLVVTRPGVKAFDVKASGAAEQPAARVGLAAVVAAAKRDPNGTGVYSIEWTPTQSSGAGLVAFLLPSKADAAAVLRQVRSQQLAANTYATDSLARRSTFAVTGVAGSVGAVYSSTSTTGAATRLGAVAFASGRVVAIVQVLNSPATQTDASAVSRTEATHLGHVEPGFSLKKTTRPPVATILWALLTIVVLLLAVSGPWIVGAVAARRRRREQERLDRLVVVGSQTITKRRR